MVVAVKERSSSKKSKHQPSKKCTACDKDMKASELDDMHLHPLLKVLVCKRCFDNYGDGDFTKYDNGVDEEGDDNYCRWCADGGDLLVCCSDDCHYAYCKKCIKRNLGRKIYTGISDSEDWRCFACDTSQLSDWVDFAKEIIEDMHKEAEKNVEKKEVEKKEKANSEKRESKAAIQITPSVDTPFTPSARKREARAKKSTGRPARIFEQESEDNADNTREIVDDKKEKEDTSSEGDVKPQEQNDKESEEKKQLEKSTGGGDSSSKKLNDIEKDESTQKDGKLLDESEKDLSTRNSGKLVNIKNDESPKKTGKLLDDIVIEEKDESEDDAPKTPRRSVFEDIVIEDNEENEKESEKEKQDDKSSKTIDQNLTSTPIMRNDSKKIMSTTIEKVFDESGDEFESDQTKSPQKRKGVSFGTNSELKRRRVTRSSTIELSNGDKTSFNSSMNTIIRETSDLTTEYIRLFGTLRDKDDFDAETVSKINEVTGKLLLKLNSNTVSVYSFQTQ